MDERPYSLARLRGDFFGGLTAGVVALPSAWPPAQARRAA